MSFEYAKIEKTVADRLKVAHNPKVARIRAQFFEAEFKSYTYFDVLKAIKLPRSLLHEGRFF